MRRRFKALGPVVVLALLVRLFAPGALAMQADPFAMTAECSVATGGGASEQQTPPGQHHRDHQCCLFCHLPSAVDPDSTAAAFAAPAPLTRYVAWAFDPAFVPSAPASKHARARAPPSLI